MAASWMSAATIQRYTEVLFNTFPGEVYGLDAIVQ